MNDEIREPYGMSDIEGIREKFGDLYANIMAESLKKEEAKLNDFNKTYNDRYSRQANKNTKERMLESYIEYLRAKRSSFDKYYNILKNIKYSIFDSKKRQDKNIFAISQRLNDVLIKPLDELLKALKYGRPEEEKSIHTIEKIMDLLASEELLTDKKSIFYEIFSENELKQLTKKLRKIRKASEQLKRPSDLFMDSLNALEEKLKNNNVYSTAGINDYINRKMLNILEIIEYKDFVDKSVETKINKEEEEKYTLPKVEELEQKEAFIRHFNSLKDHTKKQFNIENINIEEYKRLLVKKEVLEKLNTGLNEILSIINEGSSLWKSGNNKEQVQIIKDLIIDLLPTIRKKKHDTLEQLAKYEQFKETVSKAYEVETELIAELGKILFELRINYNEKNAKNRYEELILIVKGENFKKAQKIADELYQDYNSKKTIEYMEQKPDYSQYHEYAYLYNLQIEHLEYELRSLAGVDAVRFAKERAEMDANSKYPVIPDHHREPFDSSPDENAGKRNEAEKEYYRNNLIEKIIEIKEKQKEQERQKNSTSNNQSNIIEAEIPANNNIQQSQQEEEFEKELLELVKEMLSKITDERPYDDYIYRTKEYSDYLPNINIDAITHHRKYMNCILVFLTSEEIKMVQTDLKRRIAEYLDLYYSSRPETYSSNHRKIVEQRMQKDLFPVACVEKVREKYKKITKGYSNN